MWTERSLSEVFGLPIRELPEGWVALDAVVLVKGINSDGQVRYAELSTATLSPVESMGMATTYIDSCRLLLMRHANGFGGTNL